MIAKDALLVLSAALLVAGCSATSSPDPNAFSKVDSGTDSSTNPVDSSEPDTAEAAIIEQDVLVPDDALHLQEPPCENKDLNGDLDHDGWSVAQGDCNDCTALMNPGAYDFKDDIDEDCDGVKDNEAVSCDDGSLSEGADSAFEAAKSLGLCRVATPSATGKDKTWGVVSARYIFPDGTTASLTPKDKDNTSLCQGQGGAGKPPNPLSRGILSGFSDNVPPRSGKSLFALSTGVARAGVNGSSPGGAHMCTTSGTPAGYPISSKAACPDQKIDETTTAYDGIALELVIRTPSNSKSFSYDFDFYTYEYPNFVCKNYNDFFVALLSPKQAEAGVGGNISFDSQNNPVSVNNGFLEVCAEGTNGGKFFACPQGVSELMNTGFDMAGATGWLRTSSPHKPGEEITLRFAVWDMTDEASDSTVLLDNFNWSLDELPPQTVRPPK